ncbi:MAG TPA: SEC-C domain-containing protein [Bryobacteraceae bacterium]|nr:SEC-C domain-containing protein [Bryobacteraceae bacterium]
MDRYSQFGEDPWICLARGNDRQEAGDLDGAEGWFWKGLDLQPGQFTFYLSLADTRRRRDPQDPLAPLLFELALWKLGDAPEIRESVAEHFRKYLGGQALDYSDPETYQMLATVQEIRRKKKGGDAGLEESPEALERLRPYLLLNDLQRQAPKIVEHRVVRQIQENAARCAPLLWAAVRDWAQHPHPVQPKAIAMFVAMLGEIGGVELLPDLLELAINPNREILLHANWAICRLGQRFPVEVLEEFRKRADAPLAVRCVIAEQLALAPAEMDIPPVAHALLNGFRGFAKQGDAPYLLLTLAFALELWQAGQGAPLIRRYGEMLPRKSKDWLLPQIESEDFVPRLAQHEIDQLDIENVCIDRALMDDENDDEDDEDFEDDEDEDEDSDEEDEDDDRDDEDEEEEEEEDEELDEAPLPVIAAPKPGRNDPCWCGSGKKYKKCHLAADENAARGVRRSS